MPIAGISRHRGRYCRSTRKINPHALYSEYSGAVGRRKVRLLD